MPAKIECPFTKETLRWQYEDRLLSAEDIANLATSELNGRLVAKSTALRWLHEAGIPLRTRPHIAQMILKKNPGHKKNFHDAAHNKVREMASRGEWPPQGAVKKSCELKSYRKANRAMSEKFAKRRITVLCGNPTCGKAISLSASRVRNQNFCSYQCQGKVRIAELHERRREHSACPLPAISDSLAEAIESYRAKFGTEGAV